MANAFNDDKGKVDISAVLNTLETNYQNNINTIYNALVNNGVTPTAKTPAAIATGINAIRDPYTIKGGWNQINPYYTPSQLIFGKVGKYKPKSCKLTLPILSGAGNAGKPSLVSLWTVNTSGGTIHSYSPTGAQSGTNMIYNIDFSADAATSNFDYLVVNIAYTQPTGSSWSRGNGYAEVVYKYYA